MKYWNVPMRVAQFRSACIQIVKCEQQQNNQNTNYTAIKKREIANQGTLHHQSKTKHNKSEHGFMSRFIKHVQL